MNYKKTIYCFLLSFVGSMAIGMHPVQAADDLAFSVGHESLKTSKEDPKNKNIGTITAKYGLGASKEIKPYIGTGLAYSYAAEVKPGEPARGLKTGVAGQAGIDYKLGDTFSLKVDYQYLFLQPDSRPGSNDPAAQKVGIGLDIKF